MMQTGRSDDLNNQHRPRPAGRLSSWDPDLELRADTYGAGDKNLTAHRCDDAPADGQPQSGTAELPCCGLVGLRKLLKNRRELLLGNPNTTVLDRYFDKPRIVGTPVDCNLDKPLLRELQRVVDEIADDLG